MKRFRFDLEQLLRLKRWREEEAKKALAAEVAALETLRARLTELQGELEGAWSGAPADAGGTVDAQGRLRLLGYARHMGEMISGQEGEIARQSERIREKSDLLMKAMQERKVLEKLKERRRQDWRKERNRMEYANMDEAAAALLRRAGEEMTGRESGVRRESRLGVGSTNAEPLAGFTPDSRLPTPDPANSIE